jgi:hypothetical protein
MEKTLVQSLAIDYDEAITIGGFVAIAVGMTKNARAANRDNNYNPTQWDYANLFADPAYTLLLYPDFLKYYDITGNIQVKENDKDNNNQEYWSYFGFIAQHKETKEYLMVIRGTQTGYEEDQDKITKPTTILEGGVPADGRVPTGFYTIFKNARVRTPSGVKDMPDISLIDLAKDLKTHLPDLSKKRITVTGHSLGSAMATYFATFACNADPNLDLRLYTFASPNTGDQKFVDLANRVIPDSVRIYNTADPVPDNPKHNENGSNIYRQINGGESIDPKKDPNIETDLSLLCEHQLPVYMYILQKLKNNGQANPDIIGAGHNEKCQVKKK